MRNAKSNEIFYDDDERVRALTVVARLGFLAPAARRTGISVETLRRWVAEEELKLLSGRERMARSALRQVARRRSRWARVYRLKDKGLLNAEIARRIGFRSAASVTHILAQRKPSHQGVNPDGACTGRCSMGSELPR
jgi:hypothetical protein